MRRTVLLIAGVIWMTASTVWSQPIRQPGEAQAVREAARQAMATAPEGLSGLVDALVAPGQGDDTMARLALHRVVFDIAQPGSIQGQLRGPMSQILAGTASDEDRPMEVRAFLLEQLRLLAGPDAASTVGPLLAEPELATAASLVLLDCGAEVEELTGYYRRALPAARGRHQVTIIQALAALKDVRSAEALVALTESDDMEIRLAAADALAAIGRPGAIQPIEALAEAESFYQRTQATAALLTLAGNLAENGHEDRAVELLRRLYEQRTDPREVNVRCRALYELAQIRGAAMFDDLLAASQSDDPQIAAAAEQIAITMPGSDVTARWAEQLDSEDPADRLAALRVLARRGDASAGGAVLDALADDDPAVRVEAIGAAAELVGPRATGALIPLLDTDDRDQARAARLALATLGGPEVSARLAETLDAGSARRRVGVLTVLADRKAAGQVDAVMALIDEPDEAVRVEAIETIGAIGSAGQMPAMIDIMLTAERLPASAAERSVYNIIDRVEDPAAGARPLLSALGSAEGDGRAILIRALGRTGAPAAMERLRELLATDDANELDATVRAMANWPDDRVAADLLTLSRGAENMNHRVIAYRALVRVVSHSDDAPAQKIDRLVEAIQAAPRAEDRPMALSAMGEIRHGRVIEIARTYLDDETLRAEAATTIVRVAERMDMSEQGAWIDAIRAAGALTPNEHYQRVADEIVSRLEQYRDFITDWQLAGPYTIRGRDGRTLLAEPFAPEQDAAEVDWRPCPDQADSPTPWGVNINRTFAGGDNTVAYLRTWVHSPSRREVMLECGSDDGIKAWLNGEVVHENNALRGMAAAEDRVEVTLDEGWNVLLLKISNGGGDFGANARFRGRDGRLLDDLRVSPEPPQ